MPRKQLMKFTGPRVGKMYPGGRTLKMMVPRCRPCQERGEPRWWERCRHGAEQVESAGFEAWMAPYFTRQERTVRKPTIERQDDGRVLVTGHEDEIVFDLIPNSEQVQTVQRISSGSAELYKRQVHGYRDPEDFGVAPWCEFQGCWATETPDGKKLIETEAGRFCRDIERKYAIIDRQGGRVRGKALEMANEEKRNQQLAEL